MNSNVWAIIEWPLLIDFAKYTEGDNRKSRFFTRVLLGMAYGGIPCALCRGTHSAYLVENPPDFENAKPGQGPLDYVYDEKSMVNRKLDIRGIVDPIGPMQAKTLWLSIETGQSNPKMKCAKSRNLSKEMFLKRVKTVTCFASYTMFLDYVCIVCLNVDNISELTNYDDWREGLKDFFISQEECVKQCPWGQTLRDNLELKGIANLADSYFDHVYTHGLTTRKLVTLLVYYYYKIGYKKTVEDDEFKTFVYNKKPAFVQDVDLSFLESFESQD